jgi:hypothetical protein
VRNGTGTVIAHESDTNGLLHDEFLAGKKRGYSNFFRLSKGWRSAIPPPPAWRNRSLPPGVLQSLYDKSRD